MANEKKTGLGSGIGGLMRPSTPPEADAAEVLEPAEGPEQDQAEGEVDNQGRGATGAEAKGTATRTRKRRPPVSTETKGRKLHLPDDVHDRLWQLSRQKRTTVSAVAAEILDRHLPRFKVEREG